MEVAPLLSDTHPFPDRLAQPVGITELLDRLPISPRLGRPAESGGDGAPVSRGDVPFSVEVPVVERVGVEIPPSPAPPPLATAPASATLGAESETEAGPARPAPRPRTPLPSWAVAVIGGLSLLSLTLLLALVSVMSGEPAPDAESPSEREPTAEAAPAATPASFPAEPSTIPVDLITRLEEAGDQDLSVELSRLLDAVQHGFGRRSARLEPTLQAYVYRMSSRFQFNHDSHRVAVTAPDASLAAARAALLEQLFADAVAEGKLEVGHGVGPHALALVTE